MIYYDGAITPAPGTVFVFGSNPEGRHGAGAAKVAREQFGAKYGCGNGRSGMSYAIPTKDLEMSIQLGIYAPADRNWSEMTRMVLWFYGEDGHPYSDVLTNNPYPRSITPETIVRSIASMYRDAFKHPNERYYIAYRNGEKEFSLNGYCGGEMAAMFVEAGKRVGHIPTNICFSSKWQGVIGSLMRDMEEPVIKAKEFKLLKEPVRIHKVKKSI